MLCRPNNSKILQQKYQIHHRHFTNTSGADINFSQAGSFTTNFGLLASKPQKHNIAISEKIIVLKDEQKSVLLKYMYNACKRYNTEVQQAGRAWKWDANKYLLLRSSDWQSVSLPACFKPPTSMSTYIDIKMANKICISVGLCFSDESLTNSTNLQVWGFTHFIPFEHLGLCSST